MFDIRERLDAELGDAPDPRFSLDEAVTAGRRAVRRRRLAVAAAACAVAAVVGGSALALTGGDGPGGRKESSDQVATEPSPSSPAPEVTTPPAFRLAKGEHASYDPQGEVVIRDGWRVTQRMSNPLKRVLPERSVGLELTRGEESFWYLLDYDEVGMSASSDPAQKGFATLQEWVADQVALQLGGEPAAFVRFDADGRLVPIAGVAIVEQRAGVDLGASFAPAARTAVAELDVDGKRWFVSARRLRGAPPEYFPVDTPEAGTTLDSFITYSRAQYDSGEGVR